MKVAVTQTDPKLGQVAPNLERIVASCRGADLVVFPECALSGYGFESKADGFKVAETVPGSSTDRIATACRDSGATVIVGMLEREGDKLFNAAAVIGPKGIVGTYRKMHLPFLGIDRFATPGDKGFPVFDAPFGKFGVLICYDLSFPEAARCLKLSGAQLIAVPTNWPEAADVSCNHSPFVRAQENHVHVVTSDRVGNEAGFTFLGGSRIVDCSGKMKAMAGRGEETISAELDMALSDRNRVINVPGKYEIDRIGHRRPDQYGKVCEA